MPLLSLYASPAGVGSRLTVSRGLCRGGSGGVSGVLERGREARESELLDDQRRLAGRRDAAGDSEVGW